MLVIFTNTHLSHLSSPIFSFLSNKKLRADLDGQSPQEYLVNAGVPQESIVDPPNFIFYISDLPDVFL